MKVINRDIYKISTVLLVLFLSFIFSPFSFSQNTPKDTADKAPVKKHNPKIAVIGSAVIPGLGQVYNKKIWKVPVIYISLGALLYSWEVNDIKYQFYKNAIINKNTLYFGGGAVTGKELIYWRDKYRRYRDLNMIGAVVLYLLNIVDASVDANLYDFDVSDNLSMRIEPAIRPLTLQKNNLIGFTCRINF